MSGRNSFNALLLASIFVLFVLAKPAKGENKGFLSGGPIVITSKTLSADNKSNMAIFEGSVTAKSNGMALTSDRMKVLYSEDGRIRQIDASGNVKLVRGNRAVTSSRAVYMAEKQEIIFTGEPKAVEGSSVITGTKMIYLVDEDRSIVENSKVYLEQAPGMDSVR